MTFKFTVFSACTKDRDVDMRSEIYTSIIDMNSSLNQLQNIITHNCGGIKQCKDQPCYKGVLFGTAIKIYYIL